MRSELRISRRSVGIMTRVGQGVIALALAFSGAAISAPVMAQGSVADAIHRSTAVSASDTSQSDAAASGRSGAMARMAKKSEKRSNGKDEAKPDNSKGGDSGSPFGAFETSNRGPVNIQSDSLSLDYKNTTTLFRGHVHATQADGVLTCDTLEVKNGKNFDEVQQMIANGNVRMSQGVRWCTSDHAVMNQATHTVVLTGSPVCHDANDQITGTRITVHLDTGKSEVEGVKAVIFPRSSKNRDNEASADHVK